MNQKTVPELIITQESSENTKSNKSMLYEQLLTGKDV